MFKIRNKHIQYQKSYMKSTICILTNQFSGILVLFIAHPRCGSQIRRGVLLLEGPPPVLLFTVIFFLSKHFHGAFLIFRISSYSRDGMDH